MFRKFRIWTSYSLLFVAFVFASCDLGEQPTPKVEPLTATFKLTDTTGRETTTFGVGENFDMRFILTNTSSKRLTFYKGDSRPDVSFGIFRGDSVVATSIDGYAFLMVTSIEYVEPGQSLGEDWRAPNTPARSSRVVLVPGSYEARVGFPSFDEVNVKDVSPIPFSIVQ